MLQVCDSHTLKNIDMHLCKTYHLVSMKSVLYYTDHCSCIQSALKVHLDQVVVAISNPIIKAVGSVWARWQMHPVYAK